MTDTPTPEAVERLCKALRGAEHALHDADLDSKASTVAEAVATLRALLVRVDALTKENARLTADLAMARGNVVGLSHALATEREQALARLGAVERETLDRAVNTINGSRLLDDTGDENDIGYEQGLDEAIAAIRALPIPPDAAAALAEHDKLVREAALDEAAEVCQNLHDDLPNLCVPQEAWAFTEAKDAILARKEG